MGRTKFRVLEPWGVWWRKSLWALSHQWVGQGVHSIMLEMFFFVNMKYFIKKKSQVRSRVYFWTAIMFKTMQLPPPSNTLIVEKGPRKEPSQKNHGHQDGKGKAAMPPWSALAA